MNKLVVIGSLGSKVCYLNIEQHDAIRLYCESKNISIDSFTATVDEFEFDNVFEAYDAWPTE